MPTIGQFKFLLAGSDPDFALDDFVPLVFTREEALNVAFRFAAMGRFYVNVRLRVTQAAIKNSGRV